MAALLLALALTAAQIPLTPVPQQVTFDGKDVFRLSPADPIVVPDARTAHRDTTVALIRGASGFDLPVVTADSQRRGARGIYLGETGSRERLNLRKPGSIMNIASSAPSIPPQGYSLRVTKDMIVVTGADPAGTFYGVQTLCQLIGPGGAIPCVTIEDGPDLAWRGAWVEEPLSAAQLDAFAALKCNLIAFESGDFLELTPERLPVWQEVFEEARRRYIEPVPVIRTLKDAASLLKRHPEAAIARTVTENIRLEDDNWALMSHPNILVTPERPITVALSARAFQEGPDYAIDRGAFAYPYEATDTPWLIRRNIGGRIPDGAGVSVTYAYVPPGTTACVPFGEASEQAWLDVLETIARELMPRFIAARHDWPEVASSDPRLVESNVSKESAIAQSIEVLDKLARRTAPDVRLLVTSDAFQGPGSQLRELTAQFPRTAGCIVTLPESGARTPDDAASALEPWLAGNLDVFGMPHPGVNGVYAWGDVMSSAGKSIRGLITPLEGGAAPTAAFRLAMQKSWAADKWRSPWPEALNAYFDADLMDPEYSEVLGAVAAHLDRRMLAGTGPKAALADFVAYRDRMRTRLPAGDPQVKMVSELMTNMLEYLELERSFTRDPNSPDLRKLVALVERQTGLDPRADEERAQRIVDTIRVKGLFVPSSILFGVYLLPYREMTFLSGHRPLEIVAEPQYADTEHTAQATYDFVTEPGPVCRVDFDTVGAASVTLEQSRDGKAFSKMQQWTSRERGGFRAPAILDKPVRTRYLRITVEAPAEQAVLRNPRVFALKGPAVGVCGRSDVTPVLDASFKEKCWPLEPQVDGFMLTDGKIFAAAQTTFWLSASRDTLFVAAYAREPRMTTMAASQNGRDAPLDGDEHVMVTLQVPGGKAFTFAVNPLGTQFDSCDGEPAWDGEWQVATASYDEGWAAEFAIPFKVLGVQPKRSEAWPMNFARFRNNVHKEWSAWAYDTKTDRMPEWGNMIFD